MGKDILNKEDIRVTDEEVKQIQELRTGFQQIMLQIGQADLQVFDFNTAIKDLEGVKGQLYAKYNDIKKTEREKMDELNKKYGAGNLNIETGMFTPLYTQLDVSKDK